jgi:UDP-glucose 4-epimerase
LRNPRGKLSEVQGKKVVITGGAGFLGRHVVQELLAGGADVVVLDDFSNGKRTHLEEFAGHPKLTVVEGDITDKDIVYKTFDGADTVVHLAVLCLRESIKDPGHVNHVIVDGTMNCLKAAIDHKVRLFVNCSSSEVFGSAEYVPMDEKHPLNPETPYAAAKVAQDMYVSSYGRTYGLKWMTIRPFNMYGPHSHWQGHRGELIPRMIVRAMNGKPMIIFGDGSQTRDFIYVEEAATALVKAANTPACVGQSLNFCSGKETSVIEIARCICDHLGLDEKKAIEFQDARPGDVMRHLGDNTRFKELLKMEPKVSVHEGIGNVVRWFKTLPYSPEELLAQEVARNWE